MTMRGDRSSALTLPSSARATALLLTPVVLFILALIALTTAAANGGITTIKFVDYEVENILGVYGQYTTVVYGD